MRRQSGFNIIELMTVLVVAAVLLAAATPSLAAFFRANRIAGAGNDLVMALQVARAEAAKRGRDVSICASSNGTSCAGGTAWAGGYMVFQDANNSGNPDPSGSGSEVLRVFGELQDGLSLTGPAAYLRFRPDGSVDWTGVATAERSFDLQIAQCRGQQRRTIAITRLGRVRTTSVGC